MKKSLSVFALVAILCLCSAQGQGTDAGRKVPKDLTMPEIQGARHYSKYAGATVNNVKGVVTRVAVLQKYALVNIQDPKGDGKFETSDAITLFVPTSSDIFAKAKGLQVGQEVSVSGQVSEFGYVAPDSDPKDRFSLTETRIERIKTLDVTGESKAPIQPFVIPDDLKFNAPKETVFTPYMYVNRPEEFLDFEKLKTFTDFKPQERGMDFWESLEGMYVKIKAPVVTQKPFRYGIFIAPKNYASNVNSRGGVTLTTTEDGKTDGNPENLQVFGSFTSKAKSFNVGDVLEDIVGIISFERDNYGVRAISDVKVASPAPSKYTSTWSSKKGSDGKYISIGSYNVENLSANDANSKFDGIASHIVKYLQSPDVIGLTEIQDDDGDGENSDVISSEETLKKLSASVVSANGPKYSWVYIDPVKNKEGGAPNGNIRPVLFYNPAVFRPAPSQLGPGSSETPLSIVPVSSLPKSGSKQQIGLKNNPCRVNPSSDSWRSTRVSLVVQMEHIETKENYFFVVNHWSSKRGGGTPLMGAIQPPRNGEEEKRLGQATEVRNAVEMLTGADPNAKIILVGDFNEFTFARPMSQLLNGSPIPASFNSSSTHKKSSKTASSLQLTNLAEKFLPPAERYSYIYNGNSQELDHIIVTPNLAKQTMHLEIVHVNTWFSESKAAEVGEVVTSDHDPAVARIRY
ncbi:Endonuclease/exonuclease/phosphatase [Paraphysoderma sedebokerense]|nr:Endonuclease/exonuclease/phosphatase [Paraphysoderma sedebokerense]